MSRWYARFVAILLILSGTTAQAWGCYAIVVGKGVSADGAVLVGHNEENGGQRVLYFHKIPRQTHSPGATARLENGGQLEEAPETSAYLWSENPGPEMAYSDGFLNEWGVAVVSDGCRTREDDFDSLSARGEIRNGGIGYMLRCLVAQRAKSAREGAELIGRLVERFGYVDSGRTYVVADPKEAWLVAVVRGRRWVAQRVADDEVVILPNVHIIGHVDLTDTARFLASPDLVSYAVGRGWFDPQGKRAFCFREVYQTAKQQAPDQRQFRGQELITGKPSSWPPAQPLPFSVKPCKKLSVMDVAAVLRDGAGITPLFHKTTQEAAVFQLRGGLPPEIGCIYWRTHGRPEVNVLLPWYAGIMTTPKTYGGDDEVATLLSLTHHFSPPPGALDPNPALAWWKFKALERLVDQDYAVRFLGVRKAWSELESQAVKQQATIDAEAQRLWQTDPAAARDYLTRQCAELAEKAIEQGEGLSGRLRQQ